MQRAIKTGPFPISRAVFGIFARWRSQDYYSLQGFPTTWYCTVAPEFKPASVSRVVQDWATAPRQIKAELSFWTDSVPVLRNLEEPSYQKWFKFLKVSQPVCQVKTMQSYKTWGVIVLLLPFVSCFLNCNTWYRLLVLRVLYIWHVNKLDRFSLILSLSRFKMFSRNSILSIPNLIIAQFYTGLCWLL